CRSKADIVFVLDSSGSEGTTNFKKQLSFVSTFVNAFNVGRYGTQFSVVTFSNDATNQFWLKDYTSKYTLLSAIQRVPYRSGITNTHSALKFVKDNSFLNQNGGRDDAEHVVIVLTDGQSSNPTSTKTEAAALHASGVEVISVGIGSSVTTSELQTIASDNQHVFQVQNFDALNQIRLELEKSTCQTSSLLAESVTSVIFKGINTCKRSRYRVSELMFGEILVVVACSQKMADMVFVLDSSSSIGSLDFTKQLNFVKNVVRRFDIGPTETQVSVVSFSDQVFDEFHLNRYPTKTTLLGAISKVPYHTGTTNTHMALSHVATQSFAMQNGGRQNAAKIVVVLTDGQSTYSSQTIQQADKLHQLGIEVIAIGIGSNTNKNELDRIASDSSHVFEVSSFDALNTIQTDLEKSTCQVNECKTDKADIVFLLDSSSSEGLTNFRKQLDFVSNFTDQFVIAPDKVQIGVASFSGITKNGFWLNTYSSKTAIKSALGSVSYISGVTNTDIGLKFVKDQAFTTAHGARGNGVPKILIVLTDGQSTNPTATKTAALALKSTGVKVITIGIGGSVGKTELQNIATDASHVFSVANFNVLSSVLADLQAVTCKSSEGSANFKKQLDFVSDFVRKFQIGPKAVQVGMVTFSTTANNEFYFRTYHDQASLLAKIPTIHYSGGSTHTDTGLQYARLFHFHSTSSGVRPNAKKIAIVMTDGQSLSTTNTARQAGYLKNINVEIIAIGIGSSLNRNELNSMATSPSQVFTVSTFDALKSIEYELTTAACGDCGTAPADIVFLLDSSGSETKSNFDKQLDLVKNFANQFQIGPNNVQVGLATFSTSVNERIRLNRCRTSQCLASAISAVPYDGGLTYTDSALKYARTTAFLSSHGGRPNAIKVVVVMTDGQSYSRGNTLHEAQLLKNIPGVKVISIGIGSRVDHTELLNIASDSAHEFTVASFNNLNSLKSELTFATCKTCGFIDKADIVFALDASSSEGTHNFQQQLDFVSQFAQDFSIGPSHVQFSIVTFGTTVHNEFFLNQYNSKLSLLRGIQATTYQGGTTATGPALQYIRQYSLSSTHGARPSSKHFVIVLTDGASTNQTVTLSEAAKLKQTGATVMAVGIGANVDKSELMAIASDRNHVFSAASFSVLSTVKNELKQAACDNCHAKKADIIFLLDSSSSEGSSNFQKQIDFIKNFTDHFTIGPDKVQIGLVTFSTAPTNQFWLNSYSNKPDLQQALSSIKYSPGVTYTDLALRFVTNNSFTSSHGGRGFDAPKILIVMTDGLSTNPNETIKAAYALHNQGIKTFSIGIGDAVGQRELQTIATDASMVFNVADFNALSTIQKSLTETTCKKCGNDPADIVFILDSSGSEGNANFQKQLDFVGDFVKQFQIGPTSIQIGLVTFSNVARNEFYFNSYHDKQSILNKLSQIKYIGSTTYTELGLQYARLFHFQSQFHGTRQNAKKIAIIMTDGQSHNRQSTLNQAKYLHDIGVKTISIGIGNRIGQTELEGIASDHQHVFKVSGFDVLKTIVYELKAKACGECGAKEADILFLLDSSGSESRTNFEKQLDFVKNFTKQFQIGLSNVQIGIGTFGTNFTERIKLNQYTNQQSLISAISNIPYRGGSTHTDLALKYARTQAFSSFNGGRPGSLKIVVVMTDGQSSSPTQTATEANLLHRVGGVKVIAVGVGVSVDKRELDKIGSDSNHVFTVADFNSLNSIKAELTYAACQTCGYIEKADIVFALDSSSSEGPTNFQKQLDFVSKFVQDFSIGPNNVQFSVLSFSSLPHNQFFLNVYHDKTSLLSAIQRIPYTSGVTHTDLALEFIRQRNLMTSHGARHDAKHYVIVLTDGVSSNTTGTLYQAALLKLKATIIAIGIGNNVYRTELKNVASDLRHVFNASTFDALASIKNEVKQATCE
ncbi:hypothetical protein KUTeg_013095, partial [Tegillarca granosa]